MATKKNRWSLLINKFCKYPDSIWASPKTIKREVKITKQLLSLHSQDFWEKVNLPFKLNSLAWSLGSKGKEFLILELKRHNLSLKRKERPVLDNQKIGVDKKIDRKPKTMLEFSRLHGKKKDQTSRGSKQA